MTHPAIAPGYTAVITGGASGIGLAAAKKFLALGMNVRIADTNAAALKEAHEQLHDVEPAGEHREGRQYGTACVDVSDPKAVGELLKLARCDPGPVTVLMNNAGVGGGGSVLADLERWHRVLNVNLMGVLHGVQAFTPAMIAHGKPALIINTGSKQGITAPPGDTAYNVSKAGIKVLTEGLQHTLRNTEGCQVSAHLLVPGATFTGMTSRGRGEKPAGSWTADQVVDFMLERLEAGDFYILCPDNDVTRAMDNARMEWAMADLIQNRPPLSRWHPDHAEAFAAFLAQRTSGDG